MPVPGNQHTDIANPFAEPEQRISEYTAQEIATLQSRLEKQLGPEYLSSRPGGGKRDLHYITGDKCIALANEVFGFNGWSSSIRSFQVDFVNEEKHLTNIGLSVIVRVTLRDGTFHEDIGYGTAENFKGGKAGAFEKAKKEGTTDALKRALRQFGNLLGNCIYDKTYLSKVTKMRVAPAKFDENCLHRHPDYVVKKEPAGKEAAREQESAPRRPPPQLPTADPFEDFLGELDEADFNISDEGHPDEVVLPNSNETDSNQSNASNRSRNQAGNSANNSMHPPARQLARTGSAGGNPPRQAPQTPVQQAPRPSANNFPGAQNRDPPVAARVPQQLNQNRPAPQSNLNNANQNQNQSPQAQMAPPQDASNDNVAPVGETFGFFSAKAVNHLSEDSLTKGTIAPKADQVFNPRLESPSIRRTPGIDHSYTKPLNKSGQHVGPKVTAEPDNNADGTDTASERTAVAASGGQHRQHQHQQQRPPAPAGATAAGRPGAVPHARQANMVNPQLVQMRRIGAPAAASPPATRGHGQFRPPVKRPAGGDAPGQNGGAGTGSRVPLDDVSNNPAVAVAGGGGKGSGPDVKRQRTSHLRGGWSLAKMFITEGSKGRSLLIGVVWHPDTFGLRICCSRRFCRGMGLMFSRPLQVNCVLGIG